MSSSHTEVTVQAPTTPSESALLQEYSNCDVLNQHIDKMMWQLGSVILPVALVGLSYFGTMSDHSVGQFIILMAVGIGSIALILVWFGLSNQWADYQKLTYYRMQEIESELGLWHYRYATLINLPETLRAAYLRNNGLENNRRMIEVSQAFSQFRHFGYTKARQIITIIFVLGWIALAIRESILTFG